jgi:hypothetical protein
LVSDGKSVSWFSDERRYQWLFQINLEEQKIDCNRKSFSSFLVSDSKYLSFYNENRTLWIGEVSTINLEEVPEDLPSMFDAEGLAGAYPMVSMILFRRLYAEK